VVVVIGLWGPFFLVICALLGGIATLVVRKDVPKPRSAFRLSELVVETMADNHHIFGPQM